ncbi:MAG: hypothetical protein ACR2OH_03880, partial [Microthrixaceae bacterium]
MKDTTVGGAAVVVVVVGAAGGFCTPGDGLCGGAAALVVVCWGGAAPLLGRPPGVGDVGTGAGRDPTVVVVGIAAVVVVVVMVVEVVEEVVGDSLAEVVAGLVGDSEAISFVSGSPPGISSAKSAMTNSTAALPANAQAPRWLGGPGVVGPGVGATVASEPVAG